MKYFIACFCFCFAFSAHAGSITPLEAPLYPSYIDTDTNVGGISAEKIIQLQRPMNAHIRYMQENYSTEQMASYAARINSMERQNAIAAGKEPPEKLTPEILKDKEKIADYLRSRYKWSY